MAGNCRGVLALFLQATVNITIGSQGLFQNTDSLLNCFLVHDGHSVRAGDLLRELGYDDEASASLLTCLLVQPLGKLLVHSQLSHLLLLTRWPGALSLWDDWPNRRWAQGVLGRRYDVAQSRTAGSEGLRKLALDLRRWAINVIGVDVDEGDGD